jgi:hypothetical protein
MLRLIPAALLVLAFAPSRAAADDAQAKNLEFFETIGPGGIDVLGLG